MRKNLCVGALAVGVAVLAGAAGATTTDETRREFEAAAGGTFVASVDDGEVRVRTHDQERVVVEVYRRASADDEEAERAILGLHRFSVVQEDGEVRLEARLPREARRRFWRLAEFSVRFEVLLPSRFDARVKVADGAISLQALEGRIDVRTSDGVVAVEGGGGRLEARTSDGDIEVGGFDGPIALQTSDGHIRVEGGGGRLEARTSDGNIRAALGRLKEACTLQTSDGNIEVTVAADGGLSVDGRVSDGRIHSDLPVDGRVGGRRVSGDINGGGARLSLRTSDGNIRIKGE